MTDDSLYFAVQATRLFLVLAFANLSGWIVGCAIHDWFREGHFNQDRLHLAVFWYLASLILGVGI